MALDIIPSHSAFLFPLLFILLCRFLTLGVSILEDMLAESNPLTPAGSWRVSYEVSVTCGEKKYIIKDTA